MITENDIIFDNVYEEVATRLDWILDEAIEDIGDEWGINDNIMIKIVETWSQGVSVRLPLTTKVDKKTMELINKEQSNE
jgi:hypothetical protein|tara:strand:+ start:6584 stop:6820 length:237 start_codon:yes stop_codon:yes gene_type:complete